MSAFYSFEDILLAGLMSLIVSHLLRDYNLLSLILEQYRFICYHNRKFSSFILKNRLLGSGEKKLKGKRTGYIVRHRGQCPEVGRRSEIEPS
jgi:hypothetical protein